MASVLFSTTRAMEVSFENSFQPTIQLYIVLPQLLRQFVSEQFSLVIFTIGKDECQNFRLRIDQTVSIVTSILSLAYSFTYYHKALKRGALDMNLASLFYQAVLFLSILFQILGRIFILVLFCILVWARKLLSLADVSWCAHHYNGRVAFYTLCRKKILATRILY